jgi:hypothetical protein
MIIRAILSGGIIAGTIDVGAACLIYWVGPPIVLRSIATGLVGEAAFSGGAATTLLGLLLQWAMSILIAALYIAATTRFAYMRKRWVVTGIIAGVIIFFVMNYVVVPLSADPSRPKLNLSSLMAVFTPLKFLANMAAMILFGGIIAFFARHIPPGSSTRASPVSPVT